MPTLIACLSSGKGTWSEVSRIINSQPWQKVFLITDQFGKDRFTPGENMELVLVDLSAETVQLAAQIREGLQGKIQDFEIALNFASGSGKEHMALMEAVMELGLNFRLVTVQNGQMEVLGMRR